MADAPRAFVVGHPIRHSRSPLIHGMWLRRHGIAGSYEAVDVAPADFEEFIASVRAGEWAGGNVTVPHKEAASALVDRCDTAAREIGAINTIWKEGGSLIAGNTDAFGFAANLDQNLAGWRDGETALVLGAGGASRAVVHALLEVGYRRIEVANRTEERAIALADRFGDSIRGHGWVRVPDLLPTADLIVNTTSLGMEGQAALSIDLTGARDGAMATDIVYAPLETPFLRAAHEAGLRTCDGLGMLLHQAAPGFERWFGEKPTVDAELRQAVIADLEGRSAA